MLLTMVGTWLVWRRVEWWIVVSLAVSLGLSAFVLWFMASTVWPCEYPCDILCFCGVGVDTDDLMGWVIALVVVSLPVWVHLGVVELYRWLMSQEW